MVFFYSVLKSEPLKRFCRVYINLWPQLQENSTNSSDLNKVTAHPIWGIIHVWSWNAAGRRTRWTLILCVRGFLTPLTSRLTSQTPLINIYATMPWIRSDKLSLRAKQGEPSDSKQPLRPQTPSSFSLLSESFLVGINVLAWAEKTIPCLSHLSRECQQIICMLALLALTLPKTSFTRFPFVATMMVLEDPFKHSLFCFRWPRQIHSPLRFHAL